jgi:hypothetical protein
MAVRRARRKPPSKRKTRPKRHAVLKTHPYVIEDGVTQSLITTWKRCRVAARFYLHGWRANELKQTLAYGSFWHKLLEELYIKIKHGVPRETLVATHFEEVAQDWVKSRKTWTSSMELSTVHLLVAKARALWPGYCAHWADDFDPGKWYSLEAKFDVELEGYRLRGMIDGVMVIEVKVRGKTTTEVWLLETKTKGQIDKAMADLLTFDFQNGFYITAAEILLADILQGKEIKGVLYNIVRRPMHKLADGESLPQFTARIAADVAKRPDHFFMRSEIIYPKVERKQFKRELLWQLEEFKAWLDGGLYTYRGQPAGCQGKFHCDFLKACASRRMIGFTQHGRLFEELEG